MAILHDLVVDARHPASLARFWAAVLDGYEVAPYDDEAMAHLAAQGIDDAEDDPTVLLQAAGRLPRLWFQRVPEDKVAKNRLHLDLHADDVEAELVRLVALGAEPRVSQPNADVVVLADPEGNEFCLRRGPLTIPSG